MNKRRLLSILTCLALCLTLLPTAALAADEGQTIYVGDVELTTTAENPTVYARTVGGAVTPGGSEDSYNIKWDGETLTLNNADITQGSHENAAIYFCDNSSLVLTGTNTVTGPAVTDGNSYGIYAAGSGEDITLTISGDGSLTATGGTVIGASQWSSGIEGDRIIINSGTVTAVGGRSDEYSYGVQAFYQVTINNGTVSAQGNAQAYISWGIFAMVDDVTISGGEVTAEGGDGAIDCNGDPVIIDPAKGQQIAVTRGDNADSAEEVDGSPFTSEAKVYGTSYKYFHSVAGEAEDPDPDPDPEPNIYVGGVGLYGDKASNTTAYALTNASGAVTTTGATADNYTIMWDGETLTLSGATIQGAHGFSYNTASASAAIYRGDDLKIELLGENKVSNPDGETNNYGIYVYGDITISGNGSLAASGGKGSTGSYGIYTDWGGVTVSGGTVETTAGDAAHYSYGIYAFNGDVTVTDGTVNAAGGAADLSYGINADNVTISGDGKVTATGGAAENASFGIYVTRETLAISGGTVHATGGEVSGEYAYSYGIFTHCDIAVTDGTVNATGGAASFSHGINTTRDLTISGGEVTAEGDTQAVRSFEGSVIIDPAGGKQITVTAGAGKDSAAAISGSPFTSEEEISDSSISSAKYFHSIAGKAGDPGPDDSNIYVGGVGLTGDKDTTAYALTNESGAVTTTGATADNYNIMWDGETLTLKGATITQGSYEGAAIYCGEDAGINLVLVGDSTVTGPSGDTSNGIYTRGELTISGDGTLDVSGGGISLFVTGDLTISDGTVTATGGEVSANGAYSYGIFTPCDITISGGTVTAEGGTASTTGADYAESFGIYVHDLTVSGGSVNATGGTASATGPNGKAYSGGIDAYYNITISGGTVNADGGTASATGPNGEASSGGILATIIAISSSTVTAEGGTASADSEASSRGFYASGITISGGEVTATGGSASAGSNAYSNGIDALRITVAPAEREQITVTVGADGSSAAEITGSPFQEETEITGLASAAGVAYFESAAEPARYSVTLHPNGGTIADGKDVTSYLCGTGASLPGAGDVTRSGYRFAGWYADEALTDGPYTQISAADAGDVAFYARWVRRSSGGGGSSSRPTGPSTGHSDGWTDIREEIGSAEDGDTVTIDMNGETEVPAEIFEEIAGKDITVELDMGGGVTWTVDGRDVPEDVSLSDLDLGVDMDTSGISVDVINTVTGEYGAVQVSLDHDGAFGFALTLTAPLGRENAGYWANLYHYDEGEEALTFETSARIAADGSAALRMTHASQYAIVIDEKSHALPFEDVGTDAWYSDAVAYVYRNGLMSGTSGSAFSPDAAITRAQLVTILWRMAGSPQVNYLMDFDDVSQDAYYAEAVRWAASEGIAGGYGNGLFGSDDPITREQMAAILYRFAQHMGYDVSIGEDTNILSYTDAPDVSGYAVAALQWACGAGIIRGTGDGSTLTPQGGATRAQAAVILTRFCAQSQ